jgi:tetratricopeptide (TPR) repeat protein
MRYERKSSVPLWRIVTVVLVMVFLACGGCRSASPVQSESVVDRDFETANGAALLAFEKGHFKQASALYRTVLEKAYIRGDGIAIADAKYNLALCLMELHRYPEVLEQILQSKQTLIRHGADVLPDYYLLEATILYRSGQFDKAWQVTYTLLVHKQHTSTLVIQKTHFLRGLIASEQGSITRLEEAASAMGEPASQLLEADLLELPGRRAFAPGNWQEASIYLTEAARSINLADSAMLRVICYCI